MSQTEQQKQQGPDEYVKTMEPVIVVDEHAVRHHGLVVNGWGGESKFPAINVVYVVDDVKKTDGRGRQIDCLYSCGHAAYQSAPGRYWYKDPAWAKPTERDAFDRQAYGVAKEQEERDEDNALRRKYSDMMAARGGPCTDEENTAHNVEVEAHREKWKAFWANRSR